MNTRNFVRWRPVSVVLIVLAAIYAGSVPLNLWRSSVASQRGDQKMLHFTAWGAFWNALIAILCCARWRLMRRQRPICLAAGGCAVAVALFNLVTIASIRSK